jgi:hypothetical protein
VNMFSFNRRLGSDAVDRIDFYGYDIVGVKLAAKCGQCGTASVFKVKTTIELGPIQRTLDIRGRYNVKVHDQRKLRKYRREVEGKILGKQKKEGSKNKGAVVS